MRGDNERDFYDCFHLLIVDISGMDFIVVDGCGTIEFFVSSGLWIPYSFFSMGMVSNISRTSFSKFAPLITSGVSDC